MALSAVQHSSNNLSIHRNLFNRSYSTPASAVKMHGSSLSSVRLCSGLRSSYGLALPNQQRRYSNVALSDAAADDDFYTFEKFTDKAMDVVTRAKDEAKRLGYDLFGAEHVLLAIIGEDSLAASILTETMGIDNVEDARKVVETFTKRGSRFDANSVFKISIDNARKLGHDYINTEHILLGLIAEDETKGTIVLDILKHLGVDPTSVRKQLLRLMDEMDSLLLSYGTNLTKIADTGTQFIDHTTEVAEQVVNTLCTPSSKIPCLIGESRVVNTEIVRKLAHRIACGEVPEEISGKQVIMLHTDRLVGSWEELQKELFQEIKSQSNGLILFIDDMQSLIKTVGEDWVRDLIEIGELQCIISASTIEEYMKNKFEMARFEPIEVDEPSITESLFILRNFVCGKIPIANEALLASVYLSLKYFEDDNLPDEAFDLIENADSLVKKYKYYRKDILEDDIRIIVSLRKGVRVEEIPALKDIVADMTLLYEVDSEIWDEKSVELQFTKRLRDRLTHWYNPTDFLEGKTKAPIDSKMVGELARLH